MATPTLSAPTFTFAPGKTWFMPVSYLQRNADGTAGAPVNLSGGTVTGILFSKGNPPVQLNVANGGVTVDPLNGVMSFLLTEAQTSGFVADNIPPYADSYNYPTRLEVDFRDTLGHLDVAAVFPIFVFDPRFVDPAAFPLQQSGTIVSGGAQGLPGATGVVSVNGQATAFVTLGAHDVGTLTAQEIAEEITSATVPLQTSLATLSAELDEIVANAATASYSKGEIDDQDAAIQSQLNTLAGKIATLTTALAAAQTTIAGLQAGGGISTGAGGSASAALGLTFDFSTPSAYPLLLNWAAMSSDVIVQIPVAAPTVNSVPLGLKDVSAAQDKSKLAHSHAPLNQAGQHVNPATEDTLGLVAKDATVAKDASLQQLHTDLGLVAKDATVAKDTTLQALHGDLGLVAKDATVAKDSSLQQLHTDLTPLAKDTSVSAVKASVDAVRAAIGNPLQTGGAVVLAGLGGAMADATGQAIVAALKAQMALATNYLTDNGAISGDPTKPKFYVRRETLNEGTGANVVTVENLDGTNPGLSAAQIALLAPAFGNGAGGSAAQIVPALLDVVANSTNRSDYAVGDQVARVLMVNTTSNALTPAYYNLTQGAALNSVPAAGDTQEATRNIAVTQTVLPPGAAQDGTDATGASMATGGVGIRGWLSTLAINSAAMLTALGTAAKDATVASLNTVAGTKGDGPAPDDTSSASIVALIRRSLARWTSLFAILPASLGTKNSASSFPVTLSSDGVVATSYGTPADTTVTDPAAAGATITFFSLFKGMVANLLAIKAALNTPAQDATVAKDTSLQTLHTDLGGVAKDATVAKDSSLATLHADLGMVAKDATVAKDSSLATLHADLGLVAKDTTVGATNSVLGAKGDTAAPDDTTAASIVAIMRRGLARWTSLLALLPTSLGAKTSAFSFPVTLATDGVSATAYGAKTDAATPDITASGASFSFVSLFKGMVANLLAIKVALGTSAQDATVAAITTQLKTYLKTADFVPGTTNTSEIVANATAQFLALSLNGLTPTGAFPLLVGSDDEGAGPAYIAFSADAASTTPASKVKAPVPGGASGDMRIDPGKERLVMAPAGTVSLYVVSAKGANLYFQPGA